MFAINLLDATPVLTESDKYFYFPTHDKFLSIAPPLHSAGSNYAAVDNVKVKANASKCELQP